MRPSLVLTSAILVAATAAFAHEGVKNPVVKARMGTMSTIKDATATLGNMAKGKLPFDASGAQAAKGTLIKAAAKIPTDFEAQEDDPKSEAKAAIWRNFNDFTQKAVALEAAAKALDVSSVDAIRASFGDVGGACGACHKPYREKK